MALTANISSTFAIYCTSNAAETKTIGNPGRAFRITGVKAFNPSNTGQLTVKDAAGNDIVAAAGTTNGGWKDMVIATAHCEITSGENIQIVTAANGPSQIILECVATAGGQALTIT